MSSSAEQPPSSKTSSHRQPRRSQILDPHRTPILRLMRDLRRAGASGVVYPSVRRGGGECIGAFRPGPSACRAKSDT